MICYPNAKINLGLNITERRPDGYHNLETVFYPIPVCDTLRIEPDEGILSSAEQVSSRKRERPSDAPASDYTFQTDGIVMDCPPEKNLVIRALRSLKQDFILPPLHIYIDKQIPSGAGLGGGSSDAAHTLTTLNRVFDLRLQEKGIEDRASGLGADCAFFIRNRPAFASGIGNLLRPIDLSLSGWHLVLVKPDVFVSTKDAYAQIHPHRPDTPITEIIVRPVEEWKNKLTNDFEDGIFRLHPVLAEIKEQLYALGASYAAMSGSGSTLFGLFRRQQDDTRLRSLFRHCFCRQCNL
ncbi:MAG: 4-(cytidine 5'-diphospho)-2-C-methyl-D-erythritol kinase [Paraprevotella sp.]|nr:4-(cytidine 5'-diphospho)-2-C-methyl-D-erythritol kinase [Paraprevotella sp.]